VLKIFLRLLWPWSSIAVLRRSSFLRRRSELALSRVNLRPTAVNARRHGYTASGPDRLRRAFSGVLLRPLNSGIAQGQGLFQPAQHVLLRRTFREGGVLAGYVSDQLRTSVLTGRPFWRISPAWDVPIAFEIAR